MALLSALVKAIAEIEGIDEVQVGWVARHLREAGQLSQAGRGRGAAHMTEADAANLLIGVNAATGAKNGAEAVSLYRNLPCGLAELPAKSGLSEVFKIGESFGHSLEILINLSRNDGRQPSELERVVFSSSHFFRGVTVSELDDLLAKHAAKMGETFYSEIIFSRPYPNVLILIKDDAAADVKGHSIIDQDDPIAKVEFWDRSVKWPPDADRDERVRITLKTLLHVGIVLTR